MSYDNPSGGVKLGVFSAPALAVFVLCLVNGINVLLAAFLGFIAGVILLALIGFVTEGY